MRDEKLIHKGPLNPAGRSDLQSKGIEDFQERFRKLKMQIEDSQEGTKIIKSKPTASQ